MLPHVYPFRFLDREGEKGNVRFEWTGGGFWSRGGTGAGLALVAEMLAQAAVAEAPASDSPQQGLLAGIQKAELARALEAGEIVLAETELLGRLGPLVKVRGRLLDETGEQIAQADLLLTIVS